MKSDKYPDYSAHYDVEIQQHSEKEYNKTTTFKYAHGFSWTRPGKPAYSFLDSGNGYTFKDNCTKKTIRLDYCAAEALRAFLELYDKQGDYFLLTNKPVKSTNLERKKKVTKKKKAVKKKVKKRKVPRKKA